MSSINHTESSLNQSLPITLSSINSNKSYTLLKKLGEGVYATVYEALGQDNIRCAIKVHKIGKVFFAAAEKEAQNLELVQNCPHTVRMLDVFQIKLNEEEPRIAIVMELLNSSNIYEQHIKNNNSSLSGNQVISIAK
jgi:serine/threonine protein kinase